VSVNSAARFWIAVAGTYAATAVVLSLLEVPSAFLFAGVTAGALAALRASASASVIPRAASRAQKRRTAALVPAPFVSPFLR